MTTKEVAKKILKEKGEIKVKLYETDVNYVSRSQARMILVGLNKFKKITLNFKDVKTIGQAFADEIFRVWQKRHPEIEIEAVNINENIEFMINRAKKDT